MRKKESALLRVVNPSRVEKSVVPLLTWIGCLSLPFNEY